MQEKNKQKGFIKVPLLILIMVSAIAVLGVSYGVIKYSKTSKIIEEANKLTKEEKYTEANEKLEVAQNQLLTKNLGIKKQEINKKIEENIKLNEDKLEYNQGLEEFNKENYDEAKELLSKVSEISPYYEDAKNKKEEAENRGKVVDSFVDEIKISSRENLTLDTKTGQIKFVPIKTVMVTAGQYHTCAVLSDDTIKCWGT